jgi:RNA polymerase sigma-70 factor (ECF subfamily)
MDERIAKWPDQTLPADSLRIRSSEPTADLGKLPDDELMALLKSGEQEALSHLFDRYHRLILRIATKIIRDRGESEDVMQEVFFEVYRAIDRFDPAKGSAKNWIIQFAYHKSLHRRKYLTLREILNGRQVPAWDRGEKLYSAHRSAQAFDDILTIVQEGLARLTPKQREVVTLVCFEGLLFSEISGRLKEPLGNIRHHYYRGISKLRDFVRHNATQEARGCAVSGGRG